MGNCICKSSKFKSTREEFLQDLKNAKDTTRQAINELKSIKEKLEEHERHVRNARTAGAIGGIIGAALMVTPAFPIGAALVGGAAVTGIGAEIGDAIVNSNEGKNIFRIMESINESNEKINKHQENVAELASKLQQKKGLSEEDAYYAAWYWYAYKGTKLAYKGTAFVFSTRTAVKYINASDAGRAALTLKEIASMPTKLGKYAGSTAREAFTTLRGLQIAGKKFLGVVGVALDVWTLVDAWKTRNPTLESAEEALDKFEMLEKDYSRKIDALMDTNTYS